MERKKQLTPEILETIDFLYFFRDMTEGEYVAENKETVIRRGFYFQGILCELVYDLKSNWIKLDVLTDAEETAESIRNLFAEQAAPNCLDYIMLPDESTPGKWCYYHNPDYVKPEPVPIDNKHIDEDFAEAFHKGECLERVERTHHTLTYVSFNLLCQLTYTFGSSFFFIETLESNKISEENFWADVEQTIKEINENNADQEFCIKTFKRGTYQFIYKNIHS